MGCDAGSISYVEINFWSLYGINANPISWGIWVAANLYGIATPDDNRRAVFNNGICNILNGKIPFGDHRDPISIFGDKLIRKKAQKNELNKNTSEVINKIVV